MSIFTPELNVLRRDLLKLGALSAGALAAPRVVLAADSTRNTDTLVVVYLRGAMDGLSAVVPYTDSNYYLNRRATAIAAPTSNDDTRNTMPCVRATETPSEAATSGPAASALSERENAIRTTSPRRIGIVA